MLCLPLCVPSSSHQLAAAAAVLSAAMSSCSSPAPCACPWTLVSGQLWPSSCAYMWPNCCGRLTGALKMNNVRDLGAQFMHWLPAAATPTPRLLLALPFGLLVALFNHTNPCNQIPLRNTISLSPTRLGSNKTKPASAAAAAAARKCFGRALY